VSFHKISKVNFKMLFKENKEKKPHEIKEQALYFYNIKINK